MTRIDQIIEKIGQIDAKLKQQMSVTSRNHLTAWRCECEEVLAKEGYFLRGDGYHQDGDNIIVLRESLIDVKNPPETITIVSKNGKRTSRVRRVDRVRLLGETRIHIFLEPMTGGKP